MNHPETRFHAAYLFIRYFFLVVGFGKPDGSGWDTRVDGVEYIMEEKDEYKKSRNKEVPAVMDKSLLKEGHRLVTWDIAVGF